MNIPKACLAFTFFTIVGAIAQPSMADSQLELGREAIKKMTGCYLVDYSYTETEALKPGYVRDTRVYDVNKDKSIKEWIFAEEISEKRVRLQHILFGTDLTGKIMEGSELRHQAEDWEFDAPFVYEFISPLNWTVTTNEQTRNAWTRKITNLDDGLRYQCTSVWKTELAYPEWTCANYAPIPGRETRDMGRKDYQTLDRTSRVVVYSGSWLERQMNTKIIHSTEGVKTPLAKELGKNWYVRLPDSECSGVQLFVSKYRPFWTVLREAWDKVLVGDRGFVEKPVVAGQPTRYTKMLQLEEQYSSLNLNDPLVRKAAQDAITKVIANFRAN
jgi:hypothetical protein